MTHGTIAWEGEVTAALSRLLRHRPPKSAPTSGKDPWGVEHGRLHTTLLSACDSPWLLRFQAVLFDQSERYRRLAQAYGQADRDVDGEHKALVRAALSRDVERACALLTEHIARTTEVVLAGLPMMEREVPAAPSTERPTILSTKPRGRRGPLE